MKTIILMMCMMMLAGCGGGGDSASTTTTPDSVVVKTSVADGTWDRTYISNGLTRLAERIILYDGRVMRTQYIGGAFVTYKGTFSIISNMLIFTSTSTTSGSLPVSSIVDFSNPAFTSTTSSTETHIFTLSGSVLTFAADGIYLEKVFTKQ